MPRQDIVPRLQSKLVGEEADFLCPYHSSQWLFKNTKLPYNTKVSISEKNFTVLVIHNINLANHGIYSCIWTDGKQQYYDDVFLIVKGTFILNLAIIIVLLNLLSAICLSAICLYCMM